MNVEGLSHSDEASRFDASELAGDVDECGSSGL